MKAFAVGTVLVILGGILTLVLKALGITSVASVVCGVGISAVGFCLQLYSALNTKWKFEKEMKQAKEDHLAFMAEAAKLPPEQAIALLLKKI